MDEPQRVKIEIKMTFRVLLLDQKHLTAHSLSCYSTRNIHRSERSKVTEFTGKNTSPEQHKPHSKIKIMQDVLYTQAGECMWERTPAGPGGGNSANWRSVEVIWIEEKSLFEWTILRVYITFMLLHSWQTWPKGFKRDLKYIWRYVYGLNKCM